MAEIIVVKLSDNREVQLKPGLTGGDIIDIEASGMPTVGVENKRASIGTAEVYQLRLKKLVEIIVISFDGETDRRKVWTLVRDMPAKDYQALQKKIDEVAAGLDVEEQKK